MQSAKRPSSYLFAPFIKKRADFDAGSKMGEIKLRVLPPVSKVRVIFDTGSKMAEIKFQVLMPVSKICLVFDTGNKIGLAKAASRTRFDACGKTALLGEDFS